MMAVVFLLQLAAGEHRLGGVDNDDMIAAVHMGGEGGLMLAAQQSGSGGGGAAHGLAGGVQDIPLAHDSLGLRHGSRHNVSS